MRKKAVLSLLLAMAMLCASTMTAWAICEGGVKFYNANVLYIGRGADGKLYMRLTDVGPDQCFTNRLCYAASTLEKDALAIGLTANATGGTVGVCLDIDLTTPVVVCIYMGQ